MRNYLYLILLFCLIACSLEEDAKSYITPDEFFNEDRDAQSAVDAIYSQINNGSSVYGSYYQLINALASDIGDYHGNDPDLAEFAKFEVSPYNQVLENVWRALYKGINAANFAIQNIPKVPISEGEKVAFQAEARFLRAMFYFDLMRLFGGVPIIKESYSKVGENYYLPRAEYDSVASFVLAEFTYTFENLPESNDPGRPNKFTAAAFLAKYYLTMHEYARAFQASRIVIQSGKWSLLPDYASVFKLIVQNSSEDILSININADDPQLFNVWSLPPDLGGQEVLRPTDAYINSFDNLDRRNSISIIGEYINQDGSIIQIEPHVGKYWDRIAEPLGGPSTNDLPLFRFADVLLLHAEAINELRNGTNAEALDVINSVRARARFDGGINQDVLPDLGRMNKAEFKAAILMERKKELGWEGQRWFDLVRMGALKEEVEAAKTVTVEDKHNLFPIPQSEFLINPNLGNQNPGY